MGSECDYKPCDQFANYGIHVPTGTLPIVLDTYYWTKCETYALSTSISPLLIGREKKIFKTYDLFGREVEPRNGQLMFYLYDDGSIEKKVKLGGN